MKCGAKRFFADIEIGDERKTVPVTARSSVAARKVIRTKFGEHVHILAIRQENKTK